jgi:hypothetical protein
MARVACAISSLLCLVLAGAAPSRAAALIDQHALLVKFVPVLYFHPDEDWAPEQAETFLGHARIEKQTTRGHWTTVSPPPPTNTNGCAFNPCYRFNLPCSLRSGDACYEAGKSGSSAWTQPVIYGRVLMVPAGTAAPPGFTTPPRYLVRYWVFYEFDDWRSPRERLWQAHEADWESITIGLTPTLQPLFAAYSEHCSGTIRAWASVAKRGVTHPVDYVALGSHANYFTNSTTSTKFTDCLRTYPLRARTLVKLAEDRVVDRMGTAHPSGPSGLAGVTPLELVELSQPLPGWASFPGRWSEGQLLWLGKTPRSFTSVRSSFSTSLPGWPKLLSPQ